jgi:hypothetical protein
VGPGVDVAEPLREDARADRASSRPARRVRPSDAARDGAVGDGLQDQQRADRAERPGAQRVAGDRDVAEVVGERLWVAEAPARDRGVVEQAVEEPDAG